MRGQARADRLRPAGLGFAAATLFEYLATAFSIVFSLSATRLLGGLSHALQPRRRYWAHATAVCGWLLARIAVFWLFWSYRERDWTLPRFLLVLGSPGLIYFNACTLPPDNPSVIESWRLLLRGSLAIMAFAPLVVVFAIGGQPGALAP